jgi:hypothetical protein
MQYGSDSAITWIFPQVNSKDGVFFAMLFTLRESRRTSDPALLQKSKTEQTNSWPVILSKL